MNATKRNVFKVLALFYDPIEFSQPIIVNLKIVFQKLCQLKLSCDEDINLLNPRECPHHKLILVLEWLEVLYFLEEVEKTELP